MKKRTSSTSLVAGVLLSVLLISCAAFPPIEKDKTVLEVQIEQLIQEIKLTLVKVSQSSEAESLPKLKSATVNLETQLWTSAGGGLRLLIVSADANVTETNTQKIRIKLEPGKRSPVKISSISDNLAEAILAIARGVAKADGMEPKLDLTELTASMRFVVKKGVGGGVRFVIVPVTVDLGGDIKETNTHSIELSFKK